MTATGNHRAGCSYAVDAHDRISAVDEDWRRFAMENEGPGLLSHHVLRSSLWDHIHGIENRLIYKRILDHVRGSGEPVLFDMRCDSPGVERHLRMTVMALPEEGCLFRTDCVECAERDSIDLISCAARRQERSISICGWCMRVDLAGRWVELAPAAERVFDEEESAWPRLSHTICPDCFERLDGLLATTRVSWRRGLFA